LSIETTSERGRSAFSHACKGLGTSPVELATPVIIEADDLTLLGKPVPEPQDPFFEISGEVLVKDKS